MGNLLIAFTDRSVASTDRNVAFTNICRDGLADADPAEEIASLQNMLDRAGNDELVNSMDEDGFTALELACMYERVHIIRFLLENGADPNHLNVRGSTPLLLAVVSPTHNDNEGVNVRHQIIALLLKHHADPNMGVTLQSARFSYEMTHQALELGVDPTYPILVDQVGTDRISPLTYVLRDPRMDPGTIYLLLRAYTGLGRLQFVSQQP